MFEAQPSELPPHLGGYITGPHGDEATWFPELWNWLVAKFDARRVLDIGCGYGYSTRYFRDELGCKVIGTDGVGQDNPDIKLYDYTKGGWIGECARVGAGIIPFDLVWCCEFVEHIEEEYLYRVADHMGCGRYVAMTHAFPGQLGHHHVNCRSSDYWIGFMTGNRWEFMENETQQARRISLANESPWNHFARSGLIFRNREIDIFG